MRDRGTDAIGRPMCPCELRGVAGSLLRIVRAGGLDDLALDLAADFCAGVPLAGEQRTATPGEALYIAELARLLRRFLAVPPDQAATSAIMDTRRARALAIIFAHDPQRRREAPADTAPPAEPPRTPLVPVRFVSSMEGATA